MTEPLTDSFTKMLSLDPALKTPLSPGNSQTPEPILELTTREQRGLDRIDDFRDKVLKHPDHLVAALGFLAAGDMEFSLRVNSAVQKRSLTQTASWHTSPEIQRAVIIKSTLSRQYQRDLELMESIERSSRKPEDEQGFTRQVVQDGGPLSPNMGINPAEKPR